MSDILLKNTDDLYNEIKNLSLESHEAEIKDIITEYFYKMYQEGMVRSLGLRPDESYNNIYVGDIETFFGGK